MAKSIEEQIARRYPECTLDHYVIDGDSIGIYLISGVEWGKCPVCKEESTSVHSHYVKKIADLPVANRYTTVHLTVKLLVCRKSCKMKSFFPSRLSFLSDAEAKKTDRLVKKILDTASANTVRGTVAALEKQHIKCDKNTVSRMLKTYKMRKCDRSG